MLMPAGQSMNNYDLLLRSRRVVTPDGQRPATVKIRGDRIVEVTEYESDEGQDLGELALLPGLVDPHVHLNEPGRTKWEGFATGTSAAAAGGITTLVDMPLNSSPVTTSAAALETKRTAATGKLHVDVGFHGGLVPGNESQIGELLDGGVLGVKAFLCDSGLDDFPAVTARELQATMPLLADRNVPLLAHAELVNPVPGMSNPRRYADYLATRPPSFERDAIELLIDLCRKFGCSTHIVHLADAGSLPLLYQARQEGLPVTVETCPHYLTFTADGIPDGATQYKCTPPIRDAANREALWQALSEGVIDFIASDHSPCPPEMKRLNEGRFDLAWGGINSLQLLLPAVWTEASKRGHSLADLIRWLCHRPARLINQEAGIQPGMPANLVVFDPDTSFVVHGKQLHHRHSMTPYEGRTMRGVVQRVYLRGKPARAGEGLTL